jgi:hypothetical protein
MSLPFCDLILDDGRFRLYIRLRFTLLSAASRALLTSGFTEVVSSARATLIKLNH